MTSVKINSVKATLKSMKDVIKKKASRYMWTATLAGQYLWMRSDTPSSIKDDVNNVFGTAYLKPEIIIAGIPIYGVDQIGHAASDEVLKYRSMGGIFLAHQKGGTQTFKFRARIYGPMRYVTYKLLEALQLLGTEESMKLAQKRFFNTRGLVKSNTEIELTLDDKGIQTIDPTSIKDISVGSPIQQSANIGEFNEEEYAFHRTFPIITETKIYTNMYLETLVLARDIKFGKNCIEIQCAFRQYEAPTHYQVSTLNAFKETATTVTIESAKKTYYRIYTPAFDIIASRTLDLAINFGWLIEKITSELMKPEEAHRLKTGKYDMEFGTMATLFALYGLSRVYWVP